MTYATSGWSFSTRGNIWYQIPFYLLDRISDLADNLPDIFTFFFCIYIPIPLTVTPSLALIFGLCYFSFFLSLFCIFLFYQPLVEL